MLNKTMKVVSDPVTNGDKLVSGVLELDYMNSEKYQRDLNDRIDQKVIELFGDSSINDRAISNIINQAIKGDR